MTKLEIKGDTIIAKNELKRKWATLQFVDKLMAGSYNAANRIKFWGRMGALGGGIVGLFFGSAFVFIPSDGPRLVAGPLAAWICLGLAGAMAFGGLSALGAGIYNLGIARDSILQSGTAFTSGKKCRNHERFDRKVNPCPEHNQSQHCEDTGRRSRCMHQHNIERWEHSLLP